MNKKMLLGVPTALLLFSASICAEGLQPGATAIGLDVSLSHTTAGSLEDENFELTLKLSKFLTKNHEVAVQTFGYIYNIGDDENTAIFLEGIYNYNFSLLGLPNLVPYVGAAGGLFISEASAETNTDFDFQLGAQAGVKNFLSDNAFINIELRHRHTFADMDDLDRTSLNVGINLLFD